MVAPATEPTPSRWTRLREALLPGPNVDRATASVLLLTAFVLLVSDYEGGTNFWTFTLKPHIPGAGPYWDVASYYWWFGTSFVLYLVLPLAFSAALKTHPLSEFGFGLGDWRLGLKVSGAFLGLMLPVVAVASRFQAFQDQYPMAKEALAGKGVFLVYEVAYAAYFVSWEFLFRGYMLQGLKRRLGGGLSVLVQTLPFALMHMGKPEAEAYGSILAGLALGVLALRTGTFWYGAAIHAVIAVFMDCVASVGRLK